MSIARMRAASRRAFSGVSTTAIPPALPLPPMGTCAFTAMRPSSRAAAAASSGVRANLPGRYSDAGCGEPLFRLVLEQLHRRASLEKGAGSSLRRDPVQLFEVGGAGTPLPASRLRAPARRARPGDHRHHPRLGREAADCDVEERDPALVANASSASTMSKLRSVSQRLALAPGTVARRFPAPAAGRAGVCRSAARWQAGCTGSSRRRSARTQGPPPSSADRWRGCTRSARVTNLVALGYAPSSRHRRSAIPPGSTNLHSGSCPRSPARSSVASVSSMACPGPACGSGRGRSSRCRGVEAFLDGDADPSRDPPRSLGRPRCPNFVAITAFARRPLSAAPSISSLCPRRSCRRCRKN